MLVGITFATQGVMFDGTGKIHMTEALDLVVGDI